MPQSQPARPRLHVVATALALPCVAAPWLGLLGEHHWALDLCAHFPHQTLLGLLLGMAVLAATRRFWTALLLLPSVVLAVVLLLPLWRAHVAADGEGTKLRAVVANLCYQNATPQALAAQLEPPPDFLALCEYTADAQYLLRGLRAAFPHAIEEPRAGAFGIALWSRWPLQGRIVPLGSDRYPAVVATAATPDGPLGIVVAHPPPPGGAAATTMRDLGLDTLPSLLAALPEHRVVLGDLNATRWCAPMRRLLRDGLRDSSEGFGLLNSWPTSLPSWLGIPIDHVLVGPGVVVSERAVMAEFGSDHRPVTATFRLAR